MSRLAAPLAVAAALLVAAASGVAKPDDDKPPKPKPPRVELLTRSQEAALRQREIKIGVESRGRRVRVEGELVVEGIPEDFHFSFPAERKRLRNREAKVEFELSRRQREVLAFGEQACMRADVNAQAKVADRVTTIHDKLAKSPDC